MPKHKAKPSKRWSRTSAADVVRLRALCRERLLADLHEQQAAAGTPLPGERVLSERYGIPLSVIRHILKELKSEGVVASVPRGGVRLVAKPELPKSLEGVRVGFVGTINPGDPNYQKNRPAVICTGLERLLNEQGGTLHFFNLWDVEDFRTIVADIKAQGIEAILCIASSHPSSSEVMAALTDLSLPMVAIETKTEQCSRVAFDNEQIGRTQAEHILELGHRAVCILEFPEHEWSAVRAQSIGAEFRKRGLTAPDSVAFGYPPDKAELEAFVRSRARAYTACIAVNDDLACVLLEAAKALGVRIPEDLSVVGADDNIDRRHYNLTTVQLSDMELGLHAFKILKEQILKPEAGNKLETHLVGCPLMVRGTTAPCPSNWASRPR